MLTYEQIKEIIVSIDSSVLRNFELEMGDMKLKISKNKESLNIINNDESSLGRKIGYSSISESSNSKIFNDEVENENNITGKKEELQAENKEAVEDKDLKEVNAPLVGTYYSSKIPGGEPYVKIGSKVKKGDILCIVEAMKIMNEIISEYDGEVVKVFRNDEDIVEFGMNLFKIREVK